MSKQHWNQEFEVEDFRGPGEQPAEATKSSGWESIVAAGILALGAIACTIIYVHGRARDPEPSPPAVRGAEVASTPDNPVENATNGPDGASAAKPKPEYTPTVPPRSRPASDSPTKKSIFAKREPLTPEELLGKWTGQFMEYEFLPDGTYKYTMKGQEPTTINGITIGAPIMADYEYKNGVLTLSIGYFKQRGAVEWVDKPTKIKFGGQYWERGL
jgi:hypothetical protein